MKQPVTEKQPITKEPVVEKTPVAAESDDEPIREPVRIPTPPPPIDDDGRRVCARETCVDSDGIRTRFIPDNLTQCYCSATCAEIEFRRKNGMKPIEAPAPGSAQTSSQRRGRERRAVDPTREIAKEQRYGPLRDVVTVTSESKGGKRVVYSCGHPGSVAKLAKRGRCRVCKNAAVKVTGVDVEKKSPPTKREPVHDESTTTHAKKKTTRKPVRAAKPTKKKPVRVKKTKRKR